MTKEEANKILSGYVKACNEDDFLALEMFVYEEVIEAMTMGAKALSVLSLPSDVAEAAHEFQDKALSDYDDICVTEDGEERPVLKYNFTDAFKAGAEWKAGQNLDNKNCN